MNQQSTFDSSSINLSFVEIPDTPKVSKTELNSSFSENITQFSKKFIKDRKKLTSLLIFCVVIIALAAYFALHTRKSEKIEKFEEQKFINDSSEIFSLITTEMSEETTTNELTTFIFEETTLNPLGNEKTIPHMSCVFSIILKNAVYVKTRICIVPEYREHSEIGEYCKSRGMIAFRMTMENEEQALAHATDLFGVGQGTVLWIEGEIFFLQFTKKTHSIFLWKFYLKFFPGNNPKKPSFFSCLSLSSPRGSDKFLVREALCKNKHYVMCEHIEYIMNRSTH